MEGKFFDFTNKKILFLFYSMTISLNLFQILKIQGKFYGFFLSNNIRTYIRDKNLMWAINQVNTKATKLDKEVDLQPLCLYHSSDPNRDRGVVLILPVCFWLFRLNFLMFLDT